MTAQTAFDADICTLEEMLAPLSPEDELVARLNADRNAYVKAWWAFLERAPLAVVKRVAASSLHVAWQAERVLSNRRAALDERNRLDAFCAQGSGFDI